LAKLLADIQKATATEILFQQHGFRTTPGTPPPSVTTTMAENVIPTAQQPAAEMQPLEETVSAPSTHAKLKGRVNWSMYEADKLNSRMRIHEDRLRNKSTGIKYRSMRSNEKFDMIMEDLAKEDPPILCAAGQIADKWERMTTDFKKVYD
jgi:molybdopterin-biosynthesis enzyme MoeA-like protein